MTHFKVKKKPVSGTESLDEMITSQVGLRSTGKHGGGDDAIWEASGYGGELEQLLGRDGDLRKNGRPTVPADVILSAGGSKTTLGMTPRPRELRRGSTSG